MNTEVVRRRSKTADEKDPVYSKAELTAIRYGSVYDQT